MIGWMGLELRLEEVSLNLSVYAAANTGTRTPTTSHDIRFRPRPSKTGISVRVHSETTTRRDDVELAGMDPSMISSGLYSSNVYLDNLPKLPNAVFYAVPVSQDKDPNASRRSFEDVHVMQ
jgi:hypothetical protein